MKLNELELGTLFVVVDPPLADDKNALFLKLEEGRAGEIKLPDGSTYRVRFRSTNALRLDTFVEYCFPSQKEVLVYE